MGFEPMRAEHIGLAVQRLNHSATLSSWRRLSPPCQSSLPGSAFSKFIEYTRYWRLDTIYSSRCWKVRYLGIRQLPDMISYSLLEAQDDHTDGRASPRDQMPLKPPEEFWTVIFLSRACSTPKDTSPGLNHHHQTRETLPLNKFKGISSLLRSSSEIMRIFSVPSVILNLQQ